MDWIVPENKLDDQQRDFIDNVDINQKNVWIKGFPGSGKSVLLAYTIKKIKRQSPDAKIVVVVFTHSLITMFEVAFKQMGYHGISIETFYEFMNSTSHYDYILSDEVQDLVPCVLAQMNQRGTHVVVAGDENQSIYSMDPRYREHTVSPTEVNSLLETREFKLDIIHRLSSSIISAIKNLLPNMNIFSAKRDLSKKSTQIRLCKATTVKEEVDYIIKEGSKAARVGESVAVLLPTQDNIQQFFNNAIASAGCKPWVPELNRWGKVNYNSLNKYLESNNIPLIYVGNGYGKLDDINGKIIVMTYHSSKGLDFDNVFIPFANNYLYINSDESLSRTLFMVAMSRSRNNLYITYTGSPSQYLSAFKLECHEIDINNVVAKNSNVSNVFGI